MTSIPRYELTGEGVTFHFSSGKVVTLKDGQSEVRVMSCDDILEFTAMMDSLRAHGWDLRLTDASHNATGERCDA